MYDSGGDGVTQQVAEGGSKSEAAIGSVLHLGQSGAAVCIFVHCSVSCREYPGGCPEFCVNGIR